ncbi:MAG TPA: hypothetical protein VH331_10655 [Allosphingosinicella sp.]|jgi:hypothetical protein|nr:hypothetical protein [Allosphingosinicella sp.]
MEKSRLLRAGLSSLVVIAAFIIGPASAQVRTWNDKSVRNLALPVPDRLVFDAVRHPLGTEATFKEGDVLMAFLIQHPPQAELSAAVAVTAAGKPFNLMPADALVVSLPDAPMAGRLPHDSVVFCGDAKQNNTAIWVAPIASKFGAETRPCLVDEDRDQRFDHFFLSGTKREEDSALISIEPVAYKIATPRPRDDERLDLVFKGFSGTADAIRVGFKWILGGKSKPYVAILVDSGMCLSVMRILCARPPSWQSSLPSFLLWKFGDQGQLCRC